MIRNEGMKEPLKKLPFTIPELVAASPCKSTDGILYTGKKVDTWFSVDRNTGTVFYINFTYKVVFNSERHVFAQYFSRRSNSERKSRFQFCIPGLQNYPGPKTLFGENCVIGLS